jgi:hypothetical protein
MDIAGLNESPCFSQDQSWFKYTSKSCVIHHENEACKRVAQQKLISSLAYRQCLEYPCKSTDATAALISQNHT